MPTQNTPVPRQLDNGDFLAMVTYLQAATTNLGELDATLRATKPIPHPHHHIHPVEPGTVTIAPSDVYWEQDWTQHKLAEPERYKNFPDKQGHFEHGQAIAVLLAQEKVFVNSHQWQAWPESIQRMAVLFVNCSDVFTWASADAEPVEYEEIEDLYQHYLKDPVFGTAVWCIKKRCQKPHDTLMAILKKQAIWDIDAITRPFTYRIK